MKERNEERRRKENTMPPRKRVQSYKAQSLNLQKAFNKKSKTAAAAAPRGDAAATDAMAYDEGIRTSPLTPTQTAPAAAAAPPAPAAGGLQLAAHVNPPLAATAPRGDAAATDAMAYDEGIRTSPLTQATESYEKPRGRHR
jgi:hypothetical protein